MTDGGQARLFAELLCLALCVPRMCFDWPPHKNPVSRVETECRIVVREQYCRACIFIRGGRFNCPLEVFDSGLFAHNRSSISRFGEKYYNRAAFMRTFLPCPFTTTLITSNRRLGLLISGNKATQLPKRRECWVRP